MENVYFMNFVFYDLELKSLNSSLTLSEALSQNAAVEAEVRNYPGFLVRS